MNKEQLKKTLKPLIKDCIKEVIFEEGFLSSIISEVVKGTSQTIVEHQQPSYQQPVYNDEDRQRKLQENRKRMLDAIGKDSYNGVDIFAGTEPLSIRESQGSSGGGAPHGARPLDGIAPNDPGVNLGSLGINTGIWKKLAGK